MQRSGRVLSRMQVIINRLRVLLLLVPFACVCVLQSLRGSNSKYVSLTISSAGSVFLGPWTPESVGDYASGTNHVLPTYGYARMYSGVSLDSFLKYITVQSLTEEGLRKLGPYVETMAEVEGLEAHKRAVTLRLQDIEARQVSR
jgi:histidinol dehydrogenase